MKMKSCKRVFFKFEFFLLEGYNTDHYQNDNGLQTWFCCKCDVVRCGGH